MNLYIRNKTQTLSKYIEINENVYMSKAEGLTLKEYCEAREYIYNSDHKEKNCDCSLMINAPKIVLNEEIVPLSRVFKTVFPKATYHSGNAKRRLLQMPLVSMRIQNELFLIEKIKRSRIFSVGFIFTRKTIQVSRTTRYH